ncbi:MAG TPA: alkaline phosphatase family protein, partial [Thermoanaerobaculia bacterium]|nr:alkaline phosphatase family protein [Thermoanaerobaculia bacterium]
MLFVGLDGADWQLLDRYLAAGSLPHLAALKAEGRFGELESFEPMLSPLVWTTMATGVSPLEHGILDFARVDPASGRREPIGSADRRVPAIWNLASGRGKKVAVLGFWATYPAEKVNGLLVSDRLFSATAGLLPPPGAVFPPERQAWAEQGLAAAASQVDLGAYLPGLSAAEERAALAAPEPLASPVSGLARILLETRAVHLLATEAWRRDQPDLMLAYFEGTDLAGHLFAPFAPPRQPGVSEADFARFSSVPERYFQEIDRLLGEYRELARERGAVLLVASDHGFAWGEGRPRQLAGNEAATAGLWHRKQGIWLAAGPGIAPAAQEAASVDRLATTLLALLG